MGCMDHGWVLLNVVEYPPEPVACQCLRQIHTFPAQTLRRCQGTIRFRLGLVCMDNSDKKRLFVASTPNQDNPLTRDTVEQPGTPVL